jgi:regulator of sigma E protease
MESLFNIAAFVPLVGIIIFVHEFGHFITAKAFRIRVFIFSFGFGRRLLGFKWGDTDCRLSLVPLGGYVKLEGEPDDRLSEDVTPRGDGRDFTSRPRWQRFLVYVAGPFMNWVLTIGVFSALFMLGWGVDATLYDRPVIGVVDAGSPAASAGLLSGDEILAIDGKAQENWESAQIDVILRPDREIPLRIRRGEEERELSVRSVARDAEKMGTIGVHPLVRIGQVLPGQPAAEAGLQPDDGILRIGDKPIRSFEDIVAGVSGSGDRTLRIRVLRGGRTLELGVTPRGGRIGVGNRTVYKKLALPGAVVESFRETHRLTVQTFTMLHQIVTARVSAKAGLSGPVGIAKASGDAARSGARYYFYVLAVISLSVGILNLFPLAPLDGGHLAILALEGLVRRDFSIGVKTWIINAGAMVLFLLIGLVLYSDLSKTSLLGRYLP